MDYLTLEDAAGWAAEFTKKDVTASNISYLIQYGKIRKHRRNGKTVVHVAELKRYYEQYLGQLRGKYEERLGDDINWKLSFSDVKERDTTKHVHRLHPYKGKFIPQLVEYFLDQKTDGFKKQAYFRPGDIVLDPFAGSGTTLVQANELGIHAVGIDVSVFNCLIAGAKLQDYDLSSVLDRAEQTAEAIEVQRRQSKVNEFEAKLDELIAAFNKTHFPSPEYKYRLAHGFVDEERHASGPVEKVRAAFNSLAGAYNMNPRERVTGSEFLNTWFSAHVLKEALAAKEVLERIDSEEEKRLLVLILSRTLRSCRATPHYQLERLGKPAGAPYYCYKHKKICRPVFSMAKMFRKYARDTVKRLREFSALKTKCCFSVIAGDSRELDIFDAVKRRNPEFYRLLLRHKIRGIFTSPPYLGQLNYHEQHEYAYDFFGFPRQETREIGIASKGKGLQAREDYLQGISDVLINCRKYLAEDFHIFIVANDTCRLYPEIAARSGLKIVQEFKRPVLNRTSRDRNPYGESIFHLIGEG